jgi:membrane-bound lytic murein transglycosylase D
MKRTILNTFLVLVFFNAYGQQEVPAGKTGAYHVPVVEYDYIPDVTYEQVKERLANLETDMPFTFNHRVKSFIDYFTVKNRNYTRMVLSRQQLYFPLFEKYLKKYGLPQDLKYLAVVESGLNPQAISRAGAAGLWQFIPSTGRIFDLHQDWYVDERMDPEKSTEAACKFLKQLYGMFGNWDLALAAYNTGPGNVRRAIRRSGYKKDFWEIYRYLPRETRSYVPQFIALTYVFNYPEAHNLFVEQEYLPDTDMVFIDQFMSVKVLAEALDVCEDDLLLLNPELRRSAIGDQTGKYPLQVPSQQKSYLENNLAMIAEAYKEENEDYRKYLTRYAVGSTYGKEMVRYRVRSGDVLGNIARRHGVRIADIKSWNRIRGTRIYAGQRLKIWVSPGRQRRIASRAKPLPVSKGKVHTVQPGDSLWEISKKYQGLTVEKIKQLNNLKGNKIKPGMRLVIG